MMLFDESDKDSRVPVKERQEQAAPTGRLDFPQVGKDGLSAVEAEPSSANQPKGSAGRWLLSRYEAFLVPFLLWFILGNALANVLPTLPLIQPWPVVSIFVILLGLLVATRHRTVIRGTLCLMALLIGSLSFQLLSFHPGPQDVSRLASLYGATIDGILAEERPGSHQAVIQVHTVNGKPATGKILAYRAPDPQPAPDSTIRLTGDLHLPMDNPIPGTFSQKRYLAGQRITAVFKNIHSLEVLNEQPTSLPGAGLRGIAEIRARISGLLAKTLPQPDSAVLGGIVLGNHAIPVDRDTKQQFIHTGLIHILAASGLNVGIIAGFVFWLAQLLRASFQVRIIAAMAAVLVYALLTGLPPSIQRAATMLELALLLKLWNRELSGVCLLCIATSVLLLTYPENIGSIGFQFSVLTTFGLLTMVGPLQELLGRYITRWAAGIILVPLIAQLWVLPLSLYHFNQFPIHTVPLNILALLMVAPLTTLGFLAGAVGLISEPLGQGLIWLAWPFVKGLLWLVQWGDSLTWAQWSLPSPAPWLVLSLYGLLALSVILLKPLKEGRWSLGQRVWVGTVSVAAVLLLMCGQRALWRAETTVEILPLSRYQAAFLLKPTGAEQPILAMPATTGYWQGRAVKDYLRHRDIHHLAALLTWGDTTLPDERAPGLREVLKDRRVDHRLRLAEFPNQPGNASLQWGQSLRLGNLRVENRMQKPGQLFRIQANGFCLSGGRVPAPGCHLHYVESPNAYRVDTFFQGHPEISLLRNRFYRLVFPATRDVAIYNES